MREVKFRYLVNGQFYYFTMESIEGALACSEVMSQKYTARDQWIGEKDKNGIDIYENDLMKFLHSVWDEDAEYYDKYVVRKVIFEESEFHADHFDYDSTPDWCQMEIVGNIHITPDLEDYDGDMDLDFRKRC